VRVGFILLQANAGHHGCEAERFHRILDGEQHKFAHHQKQQVQEVSEELVRGRGEEDLVQKPVHGPEEHEVDRLEEVLDIKFGHVHTGLADVLAEGGLESFDPAELGSLIVGRHRGPARMRAVVFGREAHHDGVACGGALSKCARSAARGPARRAMVRGGASARWAEGAVRARARRDGVARATKALE
jgi:hypothetical protein